MSPDAPLSLSISVPTTYRDRHHSFVGPDELTWSFAAQRWRNGLTVGFGAVLQLSLALFLLSQISTSPGLKSQLSAMVFIFCVSGATCLIASIRDLFGRLVVDDKGISVYPGIAGFSLTWEQVVRCEVLATQCSHEDSAFIQLWTRGSDCQWCVPCGWLSQADRVEIQHALESRVRGRGPGQTIFGA